MREGLVEPWIRARFGVYARTSLLTLIFVSPVIFNRATRNIFNAPKIASIWMFGILAAALSLIWSRHRGVRRPRTKLIHAGGAVVGVSGLATVFSQYPMVSAIGTYERYRGLVLLILLFLVMLLIVQLYWERPEGLDSIAKASASAAAIVAGYVLVQAAGLDWMRVEFAPTITTPYPRSTVGNSNFTGAFLGIVSPFCLYLAMTAPGRRSRALFSVLTGLVLLAIWYTSTRGGMLAAGAGLGVMTVALRRKLSPLVKKMGLTALLVVFLLGAFLVLRQGTAGPASTGIFRLGTLSIRADYWTAGWRIFADHPILGTGPNTFYAYFPSARTPSDGARNGLVIADSAHNIFLDRAAESGILGLGTYLLLIGAVFVYAFRRSKTLEGAERLQLITFVAVLVAYLTQGVFSIDVPVLAIMGWIALGGIAVAADPQVLHARAQQDSSDPSLPNSGRRRAGVWLTSAIALGTVGLLVVGVVSLLADTKARLASGEKSVSRSLVWYRQASRLNPLEADYHSRAGERLGRTEASGDRVLVNSRLEQAVDEYEQALDLRPSWILDIARLAKIHTKWGEASGEADHFGDAERVWRIALDLDPTNYEVRFHHSENLRSWARAAGNDPGLRRRQISELETSLRMNREQPRAWVRLASAYRAIGQARKAAETERSFFGHVLTDMEAAEIISSQEPRVRVPPRSWGLVSQVFLAIVGVVLVAVTISFRLPTIESRPTVSFRERFFSPESIEMLAIPGFWSLALAIPYMGTLFGLPPAPRDMVELLVHLLPGVILLALAGFGGALVHKKRNAGLGQMARAWIWAPLLLGVAMAAGHLLPQGQPSGGQVPWTQSLMHMAPALMTIALCAVWLRDSSKRLLVIGSGTQPRLRSEP